MPKQLDTPKITYTKQPLDLLTLVAVQMLIEGTKSNFLRMIEGEEVNGYRKGVVDTIDQIMESVEELIDEYTMQDSH